MLNTLSKKKGFSLLVILILAGPCLSSLPYVFRMKTLYCALSVPVICIKEKYKNMNKPLPKMNSDQEAEDLLEQDLTDYLVPENFTKTTFEFAPKDKSITLRLSSELLTAVKNTASAQGMNYQKYIREVLEQSVLRP
ncbi:sll1652 [Synechocystis sp. PCC 6803]|uniref:Sll1652 protein n=3 Tax=Synechocystis TaxID=1142 RepID=P72819_SYNY3|nr:hypothetical protein MYO_12600 [Synechocystis sp. PCC 6803]AVP88446.1 hypothetical protein C7I86_01345 [Synechocystis sp. IPPAS B-1465]MBD2617122.1 hypothetical protein [Synechocystis sp. FACHB-898]MBD2638641.1 hypothetical protein [Synechocystis sp. FACHB-908]MBD2659670.1 hypothetical protein [Synechocystis sp. FACHB-929]BAL28005.1 hypothetical protein SYNGTI_0258 [Synechocystis sp. PCC 6803 substr. GT-I]BAL31175.1 hypothetical protein SYNPCCN_0258 [Synechocystis sp. PCC 6803 substr. PCC-